MPLENMVYVAFSDVYGVYLGGRCWSYIKPSGKSIAPTFRTQIHAIKEMGADRFSFQMKQAFADVDANGEHQDDAILNTHCSQDAIAAAGLPRWDPNAVGKPKSVRGHTQAEADVRMHEIAAVRAEGAALKEEPVEQEEEKPKRGRRKKVETESEEE